MPPSDAPHPTAEQIVQWILEHPDQCPVLSGPSSARANTADFDADSDSDSGSTDTVEGGSSVNEGPVNKLFKLKLTVTFIDNDDVTE